MTAIIKTTATAMATSALMVFSSHAAQPAQLDPYFKNNIWILMQEENLSAQDPYFGLSDFQYIKGGMEDPYFLFSGYPNFHYHENEQKTVYGVTYTQNNVSLGDGECVAFVRAVGNSIPASLYWTSASTNISYSNPPEPYSIIATFKSNGKYKGHVGIYIQHDEKGIYMIDQNYGLLFKKRIAYHFIPWSGGSDVGSAENYRVVYHNG